MNALLLLLVVTVSCQSNKSSKKKPVAEKGVLDLTHWDFEKDGSVSLNGEWEFYWEELITPDNFKSDGNLSKPSILRVPGFWRNENVDNSILPGQGYGTFHLTINLERVPGLISLKIPNIHTAYTLWVNGEKLASSGSVGVLKKESSPRVFPLTKTMYSLDTTLKLVLQVSNFHHKNGGIWNNFILGSDTKIKSLNDNKAATELILIGILSIMCVYHLGLFYLNKKEKSTLYFALCCLALLLRITVTGETLIQHYVDLPFEFYFKLNYLSFYIIPPLILVFIYSYFPIFSHKKIITIIISICLLFVLLVLFTPALIFSYSAIGYQAITILIGLYVFYILINAIRLKQEGALIFILGLLALFLATVNDILHQNFIIQTAFIAPYGFFIMVFSQAFILSLRSSRSYKTVEELSRRLRSYSNTLEQKVEERTEEIKRKNDQLAAQTKELTIMNSVKDRILSVLSHDVRGPLTSLRTTFSLFESKQISNEELARLVAASSLRVTSVNDFLENLVRWVKNQLHEIELSKIDFNLHDMAQQVIDLYGESAKAKNIALTLHVNRDLDVFADEEAIKVILRNLVSNAIKFCNEGDAVEVSAMEQQSEIKIMVRDSGIGIPEESKKILFEKNHISTLGTSKEMGTGLGLALCKEFIEKHNGNIGVESEPGGGTCFWFTLPKAG